MGKDDLYPRLVRRKLEEALEDSPVVVLHGPRQGGKTTLARMLADSSGREYVTFDEPVALKAAQADPVGFVSDLPAFVTIDEVQRVPDLFRAIKSAVDRDRTPGRFLLTGSADLMLLPMLSDSLAGRMEVVRLHPLARCEVERRPASFFDDLFSKGFGVRTSQRLGPELANLVAQGGYPEIIKRETRRRQMAWARGYLDAVIQRDVRDLSRIGRLDALPRLLSLAASQTSRLINISELSGSFSLSRTTIREYVTVLSKLFLVEELPPWHSNRLRRLVKTPKLHFGDTGLASAVLGCDGAALYADRPLYGQLLETFVLQELRRQASGRDDLISLFHFRDKDLAEVDVVIERNARQVAGIEVKAAATIKGRDLRGLRLLRRAAGKRFVLGVLLYDGETYAPLGDDLYAVPIRHLWDG
ncbi:MAG: ATP-binding protein [Polyangia bacterium]